MKDLIGGDRFGFERILMLVLVPGLIALGPFAWLLYLLHRPDAATIIGVQGPQWIHDHLHLDRLPTTRPLLEFAQNNKELAVSVVLAFAVVWGLVIEDMGAWLERNVIDNLNRERKDPNLFPAWDAYRRMVDEQGKIPAIIPAYTAGLVPRMKFQLSLSVSLSFFALGLYLLWLFNVLKFEPVAYYAVMTLVLLGAAFEFTKAISYCRYLHENRVCELQSRGNAPLDYFHPRASATGPAEPITYKLTCGASCCRSLRRFKLLKDPVASDGGFCLLEVVDLQPANGQPSGLARVRRLWSWVRCRQGSARCTHYQVGSLRYLHLDLLSV